MIKHYCDKCQEDVVAEFIYYHQIQQIIGKKEKSSLYEMHYCEGHMKMVLEYGKIKEPVSLNEEEDNPVLKPEED